MHLRSVVQCLCSDGCLFDCRCEALAWLVYLFDVSLLVTETCSPWVVSIIFRMFKLSNLGLGHSKGESRRTQIHLIWHIWQFCGVFFASLLCQTGFFELIVRMMTRWLFYVLVVYPPNNLSIIPECVKICTIYPTYQTSCLQWLWQCRWLRRVCR